MVRLHPVNLAANARDRRGEVLSEDDATSVPPKSAAHLAFEREFHPVVGPDGGFSDKTSESP